MEKILAAKGTRALRRNCHAGRKPERFAHKVNAD
jgi:hypothetical protein